MFQKIYNTVFYLCKNIQLHNYYKGHCEEVLRHDDCIELFLNILTDQLRIRCWRELGVLPGQQGPQIYSEPQRQGIPERNKPA